MVHSEVDFFDSIAFPSVAELGLRVKKLGKSSVTYEVALFEKDVDQVKSVCSLIHVFVDRSTGKPAVQGINDALRKGLNGLFRDSPKL